MFDGWYYSDYLAALREGYVAGQDLSIVPCRIKFYEAKCAFCPYLTQRDEPSVCQETHLDDLQEPASWNTMEWRQGDPD